MSLISYIINAIKPSIYCEKGTLFDFLMLSGILATLNLNITKDRDKKVDIIVSNRFEKDLYEELLNYDGFYFFTCGTCKSTDFTLDSDYEYFQYAGFTIVRKIDTTATKKLASNPYFILHSDKKTEKLPIILRNFEDSFNIKPYVLPYEIIDHPSIIVELCREFNVNRYLELGVRGCPVPHKIKGIVKTIVGVDMAEIYEFPGTFHKYSTDEYFEMIKNGIIDEIFFDMIFIDACHDYKYVKRDFNNSLRYIKVGGIIILHDTYPPVEYMTSSNLCSDAYKIVDYIRKMGLQLLNIPVSPGLCIVKV